MGQTVAASFDDLRFKVKAGGSLAQTNPSSPTYMTLYRPEVFFGWASASLGPSKTDLGPALSNLGGGLGVRIHRRIGAEFELSQGLESALRDVDGLHQGVTSITFGSAKALAYLFPGRVQPYVGFGLGLVWEEGVAPTPLQCWKSARLRLQFPSCRGSPLSEQRRGDSVFGRRPNCVEARFCIERGRLWQAEYWVSGVRDHALSLACVQRGLPAYHGRGFDLLPQEVRHTAANALIRSLDRNELLRALSCAVDLLLEEPGEVQELARKVMPQLRQLTQAAFSR